MDHPSNRGEIPDPDRALPEVAAAISTIAEAKGQESVIAVALAHLKRQPGIDPPTASIIGNIWLPSGNLTSRHRRTAGF